MAVKKLKKVHIKVLHGPNLNLLGSRETSIYGKLTLAQINQNLRKLAKEKNVMVSFFQSNHEGRLIDCIQKAKCDGFVFNPAAYTHTSIALRDALLAVAKPFVEVHLSDLSKREDFRKRSYLSDVALAVVSGKGPASYTEGFEILWRTLLEKNSA